MLQKQAAFAERPRISGLGNLSSPVRLRIWNLPSAAVCSIEMWTAQEQRKQESGSLNQLALSKPFGKTCPVLRPDGFVGVLQPSDSAQSFPWVMKVLLLRCSLRFSL